MSSKTVKTAYYYQLIEQTRGRRRSQSDTPGRMGGSGRSNSKIVIPEAGSAKELVTSSQPSRSTPSGLRPKGNIFSDFIQNISNLISTKKQNIYPIVKLSFQNGSLQGREFFIYNINTPDQPAGFVKIGRSKPQEEQFFITVPSQMVSRNHAKIVYLKQQLILINYSTSNPTMVNQRPVPVNKSVYIPSGAKIKIGDVEFVVEVISH